MNQGENLMQKQYGEEACLTELTRKKVMQHDSPGEKKIFAIAEYIYTKGNTAVPDAIENVYVAPPT